jgi:hypothetical protein
MTPTTDDLRALLERRADAAPGALADPAVGPRLAGVRDRIRRRRRARAAAAGLTLAVLAGGVTAGGLAGRRATQTSAPLPAGGPRVDAANRPLLATLRTKGDGAHEADARLDAGWSDLHFVLSCTGSRDVTADVLANPPRDLVVTQAQARSWGLRPDQPGTVGLHLTRTPTSARPLAVDEDVALPDAHAVLDVYSRGTVPAVPEVPAVATHPSTPPGPRVLLGTVTLPVTKDFATRSITVVTGGPVVEVGMACSTAAGAPPFALEVSINGVFASRECGGEAWGDSGVDSAASGDVGAGGGRPVTVTLRLTPFNKGFQRGKGPVLAREIPGALVGVTVRGTPYLPPLPEPAARPPEIP